MIIFGSPVTLLLCCVTFLIHIGSWCAASFSSVFPVFLLFFFFSLFRRHPKLLVYGIGLVAGVALIGCAVAFYIQAGVLQAPANIPSSLLVNSTSGTHTALAWAILLTIFGAWVAVQLYRYWKLISFGFAIVLETGNILQLMPRVLWYPLINFFLIGGMVAMWVATAIYMASLGQLTQTCVCTVAVAQLYA
jgi:hypothetical protein